MATKRNNQFAIAHKLFMVTVVAILGVLFNRPAAAASDKAGPLVYVVTQPIDFAGTTAQFGTVDLITGAFHQIGPDTPEPQANLVPGPHGELLSLTFSGDLESIDPANGNIHVIGATGLDGAAVDLAEVNGKLYATDLSNNLYTVNAATGAATLIGPTGMPAVPGMDLFDESLYGVREKLYATFDVLDGCCSTPLIDPELYVIDPKTGIATVVGPTLFQGSALVEVDGTFYLFKLLAGVDIASPSAAAVYILDLKNGNTRFVTNVETTASAVIGAFPVYRTRGDFPHRR
jgi:DNA-binding beta-propeller fold protein YncE